MWNKWGESINGALKDAADGRRYRHCCAGGGVGGWRVGGARRE